MRSKRELAEGESLTYTAVRSPTIAPHLRLLHYNDVYHVSPGSSDPVGGIARFKTLTASYHNQANQADPLVLFSGDAFNPSLESSVTKGKHMVPALNALDTSVACLGNHDLDFGVSQFRYLASQCKFPWLCANVLDPALGEGVPIGNCEKSVILTSGNGVKVGVIGLVEREWLDTINSLPPGLVYRSASEVAAELAPQLRTQGAEIVVCLTHQREPNDVKLASKLPPGTVDLILGGHDHFYGCQVVNDTVILRSGSDFKQLSHLEGWKQDNNSGRWNFNITRRDVVRSIPEDSTAAAVVEKISASLAPKLEKAIGFTAAPLDARFTTVRREESNLGNFVCDLMKFHYGADCCIMASGTIRGDQIYPPGVLRVKDIMNCFPFEDPCVVVQMKGGDIVKALENAVGKFPAFEGRFPQVSGIKFCFDPSKPEGSRCSDISVAGAPVDESREYTVVTRNYMVRGHDGFTSMMLEEDGGPAKSIVADENGMLISMILRQYFMSLKILGKWKNWSHGLGKHWDNVHENLHDVHPVREPSQSTNGHEGKTRARQTDAGASDVPGPVGDAQIGKKQTSTGPPRKKTKVNGSAGLSKEDADLLVHSDSEDDQSHVPPIPAESSQRQRELQIMRNVSRKWWRLAGMKGHPNLCEVQGEEFGVHWTKSICPVIEGRITRV